MGFAIRCLVLNEIIAVHQFQDSIDNTNKKGESTCEIERNVYKKRRINPENKPFIISVVQKKKARKEKIWLIHFLDN